MRRLTLAPVLLGAPTCCETALLPGPPAGDGETSTIAVGGASLLSSIIMTACLRLAPAVILLSSTLPVAESMGPVIGMGVMGVRKMLMFSEARERGKERVDVDVGSVRSLRDVNGRRPLVGRGFSKGGCVERAVRIGDGEEGGWAWAWRTDGLVSVGE